MLFRSSLIFDKSKTYEDCYHFLMNNFGPEKIDELISLLGRPFVDFSINEKKGNIEKLFEVNYIITEHTKLLETNVLEPAPVKCESCEQEYSVKLEFNQSNFFD